MFVLLCALSVSESIKCPKELKTVTGESKMFRCVLSESMTISRKAGVAAVYVHTNTEATAKITNTDMSLSQEIKPGEAYQVFFEQDESEADKCGFQLSAAGGSPLITIWWTKDVKNRATYISDCPGAFYLWDKVLPVNFPSFFDFGDKATLYVKTLQHRRENALALYDMDSKGAFRERSGLTQTLQIGQGSPDNETTFGYKIYSPGYLHISATKFIKANIHLIIGAKEKMDLDFGTTAGYGEMGVIRIKSSTSAIIEAACRQVTENSEEFILNAATESWIWTIFSNIMIAVDVIIGVVSLGFLFYYINPASLFKRPQTEEQKPFLGKAQA